jgi:hypothetical protein
MTSKIDEKVRRCLIAGFLGLAALPLGAQTVYKCESKGSIVYSHEPCLGAQVVDTTPTQGLDKWSGQSRKGADVLKSEHNKAMADGLRPLLGETPEQRERRHRRFKLPPEDKLECANLDTRLPTQETEVRNADKSVVGRAEAALFESRKRYRELRC